MNIRVKSETSYSAFSREIAENRVDCVDSVDKTPHLHAPNSNNSALYPVRVDCVDVLQLFCRNGILSFLASIVEEKM